ncbi:MAG: TonB-dependent receptor [Candidatus Acidiferrales bacterium]
MRTLKVFLLAVVSLVSAAAALAVVFGTIRGLVHDPQHRPINGATVELKSTNSAWSRSVKTNSNGEFALPAVPFGQYSIVVTAPHFSKLEQTFTLESDESPILHFQLSIEPVSQTAEVTANVADIAASTVTPTTMVTRRVIEQTPGASLTNSLNMITDYVPAAYVTHDMLHMRGGHQVSWLIDGVPIPNTNIAANLGPQIDPEDIDYLEVLRGSYNADYGDRTYGMFNIVPQNGFEFNNDCDLVVTAGSPYQTDDQIGCGGHTERFAYYASLNGNRSNFGLQPPIEQTYHDAENGFGGFASFMFNLDPKDQLRLVTSLRQDYYQIPYDPNPNSLGNTLLAESGESPSYGLRDSEREPDGYLVFSWVHTFNPNMVLTVSPFYHYNAAHYAGGPNDYPVRSTVDQDANYGGMQAAFNWTFWRNDLQAGLYGFAQHQYNYLDNVFVDGTPNVPASSIGVTGGVAAEFIDDTFKVNSILTFMLGVRQTNFNAAISESATDPRLGGTVRIPYLNWVFRAFYGYFYQAPPLVTATGALASLATNQGYGFAPLHGERDIEHQFGVTIPYRGWTLDADNFETRAENWLDHNNIGESNIFWPITWDAALIQGWELTLRSPNVWHYGQFHVAYSNQIAQATSPITGGLICPIGMPMCPAYPPPGYAPVDHDQRNTLNVGFNANLPWDAYASTNVYYGSGFSNAFPGQPYPGNYLPGHTTFDLSVGKTFLEKYSVSVTALNVTDKRVELDTSLTFGGFHWNEPREAYAQFEYRFNF